MTINAIETYHQGHLFRSRLEARWATVLTDLGIRWQYEPQGFHVGADRRPYLPDFYLPDLDFWIEVKGDVERLDPSLLVDAVHPEHGIGSSRGGPTNLLILGPIPAFGDVMPMHFGVTTGPLWGLWHFMPAEAVIAGALPEDDVRDGDFDVLRRWGALLIPASRRLTPKRPPGDLTQALPLTGLDASPHLQAAYTLGRTARFEHRETA